MKELIFIDGDKTDGPLNRSLFYGEGLFETFRWKGRMPEYISEHINRMRNGSRFLKIPFPDEGHILEKIEKSVKKSALADLHVKIALLSKGDGVFFKDPRESSVLVITMPYVQAQENVTVRVATQKRNSDSPLVKYKTFNYLDNIIARREAIGTGFDDAVFLNVNDNLTEATSSNLFWVKEASLFTPSVDSGLLPGITREVVLNTAVQLGYKINCGQFEISSLLNSDFAFLTNSLRGTSCIGRINEKTMPNIPHAYSGIKNALFEKFKWI